MVGLILIMNVTSHPPMLKLIKKIQKDVKKITAVNNKQNKAITSIDDYLDYVVGKYFKSHMWQDWLIDKSEKILFLSLVKLFWAVYLHFD